LQDSRGGEKNPGEFRFIPPNVEHMIEAMSDLEKFLNEDDDIDPLIKIGLAHYQFETIHPFLDGNGRIGRLLINLFLIDRKVLNRNTLYISYYLKRNRIEYYDRLMEVRMKGNYEQWIKFFLLAIYESAEDAIETIEKLVKLHEKNYQIIDCIGRSAKNAKRIFRYLEKNPIIDIQRTSKELGISYNTVAKAVNKLIELGIIIQTNNILRNRVFAYEEYLQILRKDTE